jgi:hypothetical protein
LLRPSRSGAAATGEAEAANASPSPATAVAASRLARHSLAVRRVNLPLDTRVVPVLDLVVLDPVMAAA